MLQSRGDGERAPEIIETALRESHVEPGHQRRGIGSALIRRGLDLVRAINVPLVFLEGDPAYYSRFGFLAGASHGFRRPSLRIPAPAFQVLPLAAYEPWMTGTLVYRHEFWDHDAVGLRGDEIRRRNVAR